MVWRVTGGKSLPAEVVQQIVAKTDGVPLFVEELTKMVLESGLLRECEEHCALTGPLPPLAIPTTLQDALMARLDRLADGKAVAQLGQCSGAGSPMRSAGRGASGRASAGARSGATGAGRGALPAGHATARHLYVQACPGAGCGLSVAATEHAAAVPPAHGAGGGGALSRHGRVPARTAGAALTEAGLAEHAMPDWQRAGPTRRWALSPCGSD